MSHRKLQEREYSEQDRMQYKLVDTESHNEKSAKIKIKHKDVLNLLNSAFVLDCLLTNYRDQ